MAGSVGQQLVSTPLAEIRELRSHFVRDLVSNRPARESVGLGPGDLFKQDKAAFVKKIIVGPAMQNYHSVVSNEYDNHFQEYIYWSCMYPTCIPARRLCGKKVVLREEIGNETAMVLKQHILVCPRANKKTSSGRKDHLPNLY